MRFSVQARARHVLSAALGCLAVPYLLSGAATMWHGIPGVCSEHDHSWQELLVFFGLGFAVSVFAAFMAWLAWRVWSAPSVATIYLAWLLVLFAVSAYAPLLPGMTKATSDSLWGVALWTAFWLGGPRIVQFFGLEEDLESRHLLGVWLFCVTAPFLLLPVGNLSMILKSPGGSYRTGFTWLLLLGLLGVLRLLYLGMVRWRRQGSHALPALCRCGCYLGCFAIGRPRLPALVAKPLGLSSRAGQAVDPEQGATDMGRMAWQSWHCHLR